MEIIIILPIQNSNSTGNLRLFTLFLPMTGLYRRNI